MLVSGEMQAKTVQAVGDLCRHHRRDFIQRGACSEAERDRIEAEIGQYMKACSANIARLEQGIPSAQEVANGRAAANASTVAHCHGVVSAWCRWSQWNAPC